MSDEFEQLVAGIDYPLFVVTTVASDGERGGCLVGFATQISIKPQRFLVGLSKKNHTYMVAQRATHLAVHVIDKAQEELAELFGGESMDSVDKFERCSWHPGPEGVPVVDELPGWFVGRILDRVELGDHVGHVLEPVAAQAGRADNLQFGQAKDIDPGHEP